MWSDKPKIELFVQNDVKYVCRKKREAICDLTCASGVGMPHRIEVILRKEVYTKILKENLKKTYAQA